MNAEDGNILYREMLSRRDPSQVAGLMRFFKTGPGQYGEGDGFLGIKVPVTREVVKACWKELGFGDLETCIRSEYHEVRLAALLSLVELLGAWLLDKDRTLLYDLARNGKSLWEQRIGIVSTMQFIRNGQLEDTFAIADILLHHPHDLIHKAVGWLLREAGKRDEAALKAFLAPRFRTMPRTMLRYAIEKFPEGERRQYLS